MVWPDDSCRTEQKIYTVPDLGTVRIQVDLRWLDLPDEAAEQLRRIVHHDLPRVVETARRARTADAPRPSPQRTGAQAAESNLDLPDQRPSEPHQRIEARHIARMATD